MTLPESHRPYTDKYFLRTKEILMKENLNPYVSMKVFARGEGEVAGIDEAVEVLLKYSDIKDTGEVWVIKNKRYKTKEPLMIIKGPIQSFVELETMYLGVLSSNISVKAGIPSPRLDDVEEKFRRLRKIYRGKSILYFGARHYHWSLDKCIAEAALKGGAVQTSTDIGSSSIGKEGVGTIPHVLVLLLGWRHGKDTATSRAAACFDNHMPHDIPRTTLIDTFNREITDALDVGRYFADVGTKNSLRIDTCGENIGEGGTPMLIDIVDPTYEVGKGVTCELVRNVRKALIGNGFGDNMDIVLSSGFGNEDKAKVFMKEDAEFMKYTGKPLFTSVGIGEVSRARFCTADIFEIDKQPFAKTGRECGSIDYSLMEKVL